MNSSVFEFLTRPKKTKARINVLNERLEDLREMMLPTAIRYDKDKVQSSPKDPMLAYIEKVSEIDEELKELKARYLIEQEEVMQAINKIGDPYVQQIMTMRYVSDHPWKYIIEHAPYSERAIYYMHRKGTKMLEGICA